MTIGRIVVDLLAKTGSFETDLNRAGKLAAKRAKEIDASFAKAGKTIGIGLGTAITAAVATLAAGTKAAIDNADRLNDISQRLGVGTEALSAWGYAAEQSGTDIEALNLGLTRFTKNVAGALDATSRQGEIFKALGIDVKDAHGNLRSVEDLLPEVAQGFKNLNNATLESALAQELFGKSGAQLLQFLNLGADGLSDMEKRARSLGIVISQDTAAAADEFNDQLANLKALGAGATTQLAAELLPALTDIVVQFRDGIQEGGKIAKVIEFLGDEADGAAKDFAFFSQSIGEFTSLVKLLGVQAASTLGVLTSITQLDFSGAVKSFASLMGARDRTLTLLSENSNERKTPDVKVPGLDLSMPWEKKNSFSAVPLDGVGTTLPNREAAVNAALGDKGGGSKKAKKEGKSEAEKEADQLKAAYDRMNESLAQQVALFGQDGEAAQVRYEIEHGELQKLSQVEKDRLIAQAERLDVLHEEAEVQKELDEINKRREKAAQQVLADIQSERDLLGQTVEYQDTYNKLKYAGVEANSAFGQSIIEANKALHEQAKVTANQVELMDTFRHESSNAIADVVNGTKSLKDAFTDMFDAIAQRITQMIAERWIEQMFGEIGSAGGGTTGGGWIAAIAGLFSGARASGGPVFDGGSYLVGERGPELFVPRTSGTVVPAGATAQMMGGGGTVNQNFIVPGPVDKRTREQMARMSGREAARGMSRTGR